MSLSFDGLSYRLFSHQFEGLWAALAYLAAAALVALLFWMAGSLLKARLFPRLLAKWENRRPKAFFILLKGFERPLPMLVKCAGLFLALGTFPWSGPAAGMPQLLTRLFRVAAILLISAGLWRSSDLCGLLLASAQQQMDIAASKTLSNFLNKVYQALVAALAGITVLNELGFNASGLITGVGLAGLTVSLAAQDTASNLFSGLVILLERPFDLGDWISVGDVEGTVEDITFRSTKIRALDNSLYVLPNSTVGSATINNANNRSKRLFRFTLGVVYTVTRAQLERLMADLESFLKNDKNVYEDSVTVRLTGFGSSSIDILVSCYVRTTDMGTFLAIQNQLNLDILDIMRKNGVGFAYPSASVYLENAGESAARPS